MPLSRAPLRFYGKGVSVEYGIKVSLPLKATSCYDGISRHTKAPQGAFSISEVQLSVLIATPCYQGLLTTALFRSLIGITDLCAQERIDCNLLIVEGEAAITRGRSNLAATFLGTDYQTFAMIDADILIDPEDFLKLLRLNKPIRGAAVCLKTLDHSESLNVYVAGERVKRADMPADPFEVEYLGAAVMLIEREVIETLSDIDELKYLDPINGPGCHIFAEQIVDGALLSEDFSFCHRAREHGFSVWCEPSIVCSHFGPSSWKF